MKLTDRMASRRRVRTPGAARRAMRDRAERALLPAVLAALAAAAPASAATVVAQWRFDEDAGQVALDDGPHGLHGTLGTTAGPDDGDPVRVPGRAGGALRFASSGTRVQVPTNGQLDLRQLTVEVVARAAGSPGPYRYLVARGGRGCFAGSYGLYTGQGGGIAFYVFDGERYHVSAAVAPGEVWDGEWHRLTGTFDGLSSRVFVDGREVGVERRVPNGTEIEYASMPSGIFFGEYPGSCRLPFTGDLDSVRILARAQDPGLIAREQGAPGRLPPLRPATAPRTIEESAPRPAPCRVRAWPRRIVAGRRSTISLRATGPGARPLSRARIAVRRSGARRVLAVRRTDVRGRARLAVTIRGGGRLRLGTVGAGRCAPAFVHVLGSGR